MKKGMKRSISTVVCLVSVLLVVNSAHADLNLIGQGTSAHGTYNLIYDTDLDITWYDYSNAPNSWDNQMAWADALSVTFGSNTYTDWHLPITFDESCDFSYNCTNSEMGHLYYTELGNTAHGPLSNIGDFQNLLPGDYWSGEDSADPSKAWDFATHTGHQEGDNNKYYDEYGIPLWTEWQWSPNPYHQSSLSRAVGY